MVRCLYLPHSRIYRAAWPLIRWFRNGRIWPWECLWQSSVGPSVQGMRCSPLPEMRQFPLFRPGVMANDPLGAIRGSEFKIPVLRCQPTVKDLRNLQTVFTNLDPSRRFLAAISSVAFHLNTHAPLTLAMPFHPTARNRQRGRRHEPAIKSEKATIPEDLPGACEGLSLASRPDLAYPIMRPRGCKINPAKRPVTKGGCLYETLALYCLRLSSRWRSPPLSLPCVCGTGGIV